MIPTKRSLTESESANGSVNTVKRAGDSVVRPTGFWSSSVHELLQFLELHGFRYSPTFIAFDEEAKTEELSYLDGEIALRPWPEILKNFDGLRQIAEMLLQYHQIISQYQPSHARWHLKDRSLPPNAVIRHGDLGPWNMVWKQEKLVGLIDWDFAEPGTMLEDIAQAAWHCIPLKPAKRVLKTGVQPEQQRERFAFFCAACEVSPTEVLETLQDIQKQELTRIKTHGANGLYPWSMFLELGDLTIVTEDAEWLAQEFNL